jgi:hypothetical protein
MEQNDGRAGTAVAAIVGDDGPEVSALRRLPARIQHRRPGLVDEDAIGAAQMGPHVAGDRLQVEAGAADPVAERAAIQIDPLSPEDLRLSIKGQMVAELRDDDPGDEGLRGQPTGDDVLGGVRLRHGLRAAAAGVSGPARHQNPELRRDHVQPFRHVLPDLRHLAAAARAERAGRRDHPFDPGQLGRQMPAVALGLAGRLRARAPQRRFGLLLRRLEHPLSQLGVFQGEVELVGRQLLGTLAELRPLRRTQDILKPAIGLLHLGERRLDLGKAGLQRRVLTGESLGIHRLE